MKKKIKIAKDERGYVQGTNFTAKELDSIELILAVRKIVGRCNGFPTPRDMYLLNNTSYKMMEWALNQLE